MIDRLFELVEYRNRVCVLMARGMTRRAATVVIDACMYGKGCTEGRVRENIQSDIDQRKP